MSAIDKFKQRLQQEGFQVNKNNNLPSNQQEINQQKQNLSKSRSQSQVQAPNFSKNQLTKPIHQAPTNIHNISRKAVQYGDSKTQDKSKIPKPVGNIDPLKRKKFDLNSLIPNPCDDLKFEKTANQEREIITKSEDRNENLQTATSDNIRVEDSNTILSIEKTLTMVEKKLASAQAKMSFNFGKKDKQEVQNKDPNIQVSNFNIQKPLPPLQNKHNSDHLINTVDHSDIKNTQKVLFNSNQTDSTALMSGKQSLMPNQMTTPADNYKASQFTLNILGDSGKQEQSPAATNFQDSAKYQDTDEQGNRRSILPNKTRPKVPSAKKQEPKDEEPLDKESKDDDEDFVEPKKSVKKASKKKTEVKKKEPKNFIERNKSQISKVSKESKPIQKKETATNGVQQRTNFVKMNLKSYKPRLRGAAYTNKIMAKKRNQMRFNDRFKRKMQIEAAKNRDQVNSYGGLGKVGLDHEGGLNVESDQEDLVPGFSASAMRFVKKTQSPDDDLLEDPILEQEEEDDQLIENLEEMAEQIEEIEELKDESSFDPADGNFDKAQCKIPKLDEDYVKILKEKFGHETFKKGQLEAIKILVEQQENTLVVLATGGGKSLIYQYASLFMQGLVIVVTPLISLMTDQLQKLPEFIPGASLNSHQNFALKKQVIQAVQEKHIKVLFISPEKFFLEDLSKYNRQIAMICVDEIHCASEWSHNFRPAYLKLNDMIKEKAKMVNQANKKCVILGLTATATKATQKSICDIFDIKHPDHIITEPNLSRMNLSLSITRDTDKLRALLALLGSGSFKKLTSVLIFATHKATCERLASHLNIRVLVCTIAFSMGIDKSDIQSVIHYDMPKSIENYVQEIGRAGRDGKLARCHLFLCNDDFYQIRRLILTDLLDQQNALKLTNRIIVEAKKKVLSIIRGEPLTKNRKRKLKQISGGEDAQAEAMIEDFQFESEINRYYEKAEDGTSKIPLQNIPNLRDKHDPKLYLFLDVKETLNQLDLKKEVVLTMLNSLEKMPQQKRFFKLEGILPEKIGVRFHMIKPEEMAEKNEFIRKYLEIAKEHQGVWGCSLSQLAYEMGINPFHIPKILFNLQNNGEGDISYDTDHESFVLRLVHIPSGGQTLDLSSEMLKETRRIEKNMIQKLNCMYFVARKVSLPTVDFMLKKEKSEDKDEGLEMYKGFSKDLNDLINMYFNIENEENMEIQIAGSEEERNVMMPLLYIDSHREKANVESDIKSILRDFHENSGTQHIEASERMKPLDVVKILMGIYSERSNVKRYMNESKYWAKMQEYDYEDVFKVATSTVTQFYLDQINGGAVSQTQNDSNLVSQPLSKKRKLNA